MRPIRSFDDLSKIRKKKKKKKKTSGLFEETFESHINAVDKDFESDSRKGKLRKTEKAHRQALLLTQRLEGYLFDD